MSFGLSQALISIYSLLTVLTSVFALVRWIRGPGKLITELIQRTLSWWAIVTTAAVCLFFNVELATLSLMTLSFFAFNEIVSKYDLQVEHKKLLRSCYFAIPIQYTLAYFNTYDLFLTFLPVTMFILLSLRGVVSGASQEFNKATGAVHWSLMMTVFSFSHIALLYSHNLPLPMGDLRFHLVLFLIVTTELNDVFQFTWGKLFGKRKIIPHISPNKTMEGLLGGVLSTMMLAYFLKDFILVSTDKALILGFLISVTGFFGDILFSAVKRDLKIKDLGSSLPGHGGLLDRVDSLALTAMVFFYALKFI